MAEAAGPAPPGQADQDNQRPGAPEQTSAEHVGAGHIGAGRGATILHVDMDAFFAAVEVLDNPRLAGLPVIVGGTGRRGVVASCTYEARAFGVRSAMPSVEARRRCPQAVFVAGHYQRYSECSRAIHEVFSRYTPLVEGIALDEAFLDVSHATRLFGSPPAIAARVRQEIRTELGLSCSVGVAATKFVAKLASEAAKPRASLQGTIPGPGVVTVEPGRELEFLHPMPVEALWGVGPATATRLRRLGLTTVGHLAAVPASALETAVGRAHGRHLHQLAWAIDPRPVQPNQAPKSIGHEETWAHDRYDHADLHRQLVRMGDAVAGRLRRAAAAGKTVTVKIRFGDFRTITRSQSLPVAVDAGPVLAEVATALLARVDVSPGVRLLGLSVSALQPAGSAPGAQLSLDLEGAEEAAGPAGGGYEQRQRAWEAASSAMDAVREKYGDQALGPATLLGEQGMAVKRQGDSQWGPGAW